MKTKLLTMFALMLCMGAFLLPVSAFAAAETDPPTVKAWLDGDMLFIEAADSGSGVEAVFIDDERVNYRVDGGLALSASDYGDEGDTITVYAVDFAGNKSETVTVDIPVSATVPPAQSNPFTPAGQAEVVDQAAESDGKVFYTFTTPEGNIFYLVIDHQRESENVYFLNAVTENDLFALAESSGNGSPGAIPTPDPVPNPNPEPTPEPEPEEPEKESGGNGTMILVVLAIIAVGGAGYYIKIVRPKQQAAAMGDDDFEDEDDEDEMEFEEEPEDDEVFTEDDEVDPEAEGE